MARLRISGGHRPPQWHLLTIIAFSLGSWVCWPGSTAGAQGAAATADRGALASLAQATPAVVTELEVKSDFSHIVVRKQGNVRSLIFLHDDGTEGLESEQDLSQPHRLLLSYSHYMFTSYLFRPKPQQVLLVGLGGGSMVHFLKHHDPELRVDVVEIDPAIVKIADVYFGVRTGGKVKILLQDAFKYLTTTKESYDVVYMDAFLKPSANTDISGVPLRLKTVRFLKNVQKRLKPEGLVVFNVHVYDDTKETLATIREAFPQVYVFQVEGRLSLVVVGSLAKQRVNLGELRQRAKQLDRRFQTSFSFQELLSDLEP